MTSGPAGGPRPFAQAEYAIVVAFRGSGQRDTARDIADILRSEYSGDDKIVPRQGGDAVALITSNKTNKDQLDRVEKQVEFLSDVREAVITIRPA